MAVKRRPYKDYTREFRPEALRLMGEADLKATEIAMQSGIRATNFTSGKTR